MKCIVRNITAQVSRNPEFTIKGISFALGEGQILAVLGQSGSGKTSLLNALAGFLPVQHGAIILDDNTVSCASFCLPPIDRDMGIIFQDHNLLPHLTLFENITLGMEKQEIIERKKEISTMLGDLQLYHLQETLPHQVSGGQQQRVALGRAILHEKKLLLFDEPFSGLDRGRMIQLATTIRESVQKYKRIAILVTHHIEEAFLIADMIGVMNEGVMLEVSTPERMYHSPEKLSTAAYVGPVNVLKGERQSEHTLKTVFGSVKVVNSMQKADGEIQLLTRPDDYEITKGTDYIVDHVQFSGMSQTVRVKGKSMILEIALAHHRTLRRGDRVSVSLKNEHGYVAYGIDGEKL